MSYESESNDILIACTGESLITRSLSKFREERFLRMVQMLRDADVAFTNAECLFQNYEDHPNTVAGGGAATGTYLASHPRNIKELQWAGIDVVACANNHGSDYGEGGFSLSTIANRDDVEANLKWVRDARRMADWVLVSFHNHGASPSPDEPSEHAKLLARACIEAGADVFIGHGPHRDRGIEIYQGKPIWKRRLSRG